MSGKQDTAPGSAVRVVPQRIRASRRSRLLAAALLVPLTVAACTEGGPQLNMGTRETAGTAIGTLAGGVAGALLGRGNGRIIAAIGGALIGGLIGNRVGAALDEQEQRSLALTARHALTAEADAISVPWVSDARPDVRGTVVAGNTRVESHRVQIMRDARVAPAPGMQLIGARYVANSEATVRLAPDAAAQSVQTIPRGGAIWAVGHVEGQPWIQVAQDGRAIGYVADRSIARAADRPAPGRSGRTGAPAAFDLDAGAAVRGPADLDALGPDRVADQVVASVTCRDLTTSVHARGREVNGTQTACRSPDGAWELN